MSNARPTASQTARTVAKVNADIEAARSFCVFSAGFAVFGFASNAVSVAYDTFRTQGGWLIFMAVLSSVFGGASLYFFLKHKELLAERHSISN